HPEDPVPEVEMKEKEAPDAHFTVDKQNISLWPQEPPSKSDLSSALRKPLSFLVAFVCLSLVLVTSIVLQDVFWFLEDFLTGHSFFSITPHLLPGQIQFSPHNLKTESDVPLGGVGSKESVQGVSDPKLFSGCVEGNLGCFQVLAITNNAAMNIVELIPLEYDCASLGQSNRSEPHFLIGLFKRSVLYHFSKTLGFRALCIGSN
ncbi:C-type lectin domain family 4 member K, partial [Sigmodon hispidus]